jgi:uncharacterized cysteine cluster protein YcgN (CxxCxxCC family)
MHAQSVPVLPTVVGGTQEPAAFWQRVPLSDMTTAQWEALCDRCGRCCLEKFVDRRNGKVQYTDVPCAWLDPLSCTCRDYPDRRQRNPECVPLSPHTIHRCRWLPRTCAYRLLAEGRDLAWWHPLVSGCADTVHGAGISLRGCPLHTAPVSPEDLAGHVVDWSIWSRRARPD